MYTSIAFVALLTMLAAPSAQQGPRWHHDYDIAHREARKDGKPLAVFVGSGKHGYAELSRDGPLGPSTRQFLAANYVCLYVDAQQKAGRGLADQLAISQGRGLVISDRTGELQAFAHDGNLPEAELTRQLHHFADPALVVRTTVTTPDVYTSNYPPETPPAPAFSSMLAPSAFGIPARSGSC